MDKKFYTYIILTENDTLYCGYTDTPLARFEKHKTGTAAKYTRANKPIKMVYLQEFNSKSEAMKEEYRIKKLPRSQKLLLISSELNLLKNNDLTKFP